jgi:alkanesulfonate monooxygenase SsuD/methylene tetrahydromethanopterin reductase-like flavin-dependent oxidoreductase (luciferase family)
VGPAEAVTEHRLRPNVRYGCALEDELTQAEKDTPTVIADGRRPRLLAGSPTTVRDQIEQMTKATGVQEVMVQEVMVQDVVADPEARAHSRALLAQALGATPAVAAAS